MRWVIRYASTLVVRRIVLCVLAVVLSLFGLGRAHAQAVCSANYEVASSGGCQDEGEAWAMGVAAYNTWAATITTVSKSLCAPEYLFDGVGQKQAIRIKATFNGGACGTGLNISRAFNAGATCTSRNSTKLADASLGYSTPSSCIAGCAVQGTSFSGTSGSVMTYGMRDRTYTGGTCEPTKPTNDIGDLAKDKEDSVKPKQLECNALGNGQTGCQKPNGDYCATASTGKTFCWQPAESGKKVDGGDAQVKSKKGDAVSPPDVSIEDKEWQRKEGHQQTACINNTCTTYNVTNYQTAPSGSAKNSTGDNNADGSGNTSGNGKPSKGDDDGKDKGDGDSAADSGNCEAPPSCTGDTLKCLHLRYTWKTECNTRPSEMTKGDGCGENDVPVCAGSSCKAEAYAGVLQQWKQRCAMQALGEGMASRAAGIGNGDDAGVVDGIWGGESGGTGLTLRQDLINVGGGGGSLLPDVEIEGQHWNVPAGFYDAIASIRMVIIAMCTVIAMFVVGRSI